MQVRECEAEKLEWVRIVDAKTAWIARLRDTLLAVQWSERWYEDQGSQTVLRRRCPICSGSPGQLGHRPECIIGRALAATPQETEEDGGHG